MDEAKVGGMHLQAKGKELQDPSWSIPLDAWTMALSGSILLQSITYQ